MVDDKKISELTPITIALDAMEIPMNNAGTTNKITRANLLQSADITMGTDKDIRVNSKSLIIQDTGTGFEINFRIALIDSNVTLSVPNMSGVTATNFITGAAGGVQNIVTKLRFADDALQIQNPLTSDDYTILGGAITTDVNASLPDLAGDDTFVFEADTQTLTNKTIAGGDNTLTGITGITGLGAQAQDLDVDGFDINDLSNLEFRASEGVPSTSTTAIHATATTMTFNIPTGDFYKFMVQGVSKMTFDATAMDIRGSRFEGIGSTTDATTGALRLGNASLIGWINAGASANLTFGVNSSDQFAFTGGNLLVSDIDIVLGTTTGTKIGTGVTQKIGFWDVTPVVQPGHIADPTDLATAITAINAILADLAELGLQAAS